MLNTELLTDPEILGGLRPTLTAQHRKITGPDILGGLRPKDSLLNTETPRAHKLFVDCGRGSLMKDLEPCDFGDHNSVGRKSSRTLEWQLDSRYRIPEKPETWVLS